MPSGRFVVLEGIDGCGKTTQLQSLRQWLPASGLMAPGRELLVTREPGGTPLGERVRTLLKHETDVPLTPEAELLLFSACRGQVVHDVIRPALGRECTGTGFRP